MDKFIGQVIKIAPHKYRWIVRKNEKGRYIVRTPKRKILLNTLHLKRNRDFGKEHLLPKLPKTITLKKN